MTYNYDKEKRQKYEQIIKTYVLFFVYKDELSLFLCNMSVLDKKEILPSGSPKFKKSCNWMQ